MPVSDRVRRWRFELSKPGVHQLLHTLAVRFNRPSGSDHGTPSMIVSANVHFPSAARSRGFPEFLSVFG